MKWLSHAFGLRKAVFHVVCRKETAQRFFIVMPDGVTVIEGVGYTGFGEKIKDAANACPVQVIMYDET